MRHNRGDVLVRAHQLVSRYGLGALTMRRLGAELGVQPSAIYHHFANKQTLLAAVAEEILRQGSRARTCERDDWTGRLREVCSELRDAMLACTDGADVVATVWAFGMGAQAPAAELEDVLRDAGLDDGLALVGSRTLLHYVFGHAFEEQTAIQAVAAGAVERDLASLPDFWTGLDVVIDGLRARLP
ncbi:TetR family transcriptional regulator [Nocardioides piscis]|uniref:TetR family transcriptional regulator n=1 Tax=Nocardioides piscis TaxID=2714938 RepID=A0A6G7YJV8_9ACTN|nr:TetR family transcriptional regulator [Nocardioides piscis]QIK77022.1 TetR family transcriptional regulator [Nocardioides piscis]